MCVWSSRPFAWRFGPAGWRKVKKGKEEKRASDSRDSNKIASNVGFPFLYLRPPIFLLFTEIGYFLSLQHFYQVVYLFGFSHHRNRMKRGSGEEGKKKNVRGEKNKKEKSSKLRNEVSISGVYCTVHSSLFLISLSCPTTIPPVSILTSSPSPIPSNWLLPPLCAPHQLPPTIWLAE